MGRVAYVNGRFVRHDAAAVHIEDRGYQFADGVYEVVTILAGDFVDQPGHLARLRRSLGELRIAMPVRSCSAIGGIGSRRVTLWPIISNRRCGPGTLVARVTMPRRWS